MQKSILCYGDSNTWGYVPSKEHSDKKLRYARDERWTGILQNLLGNNFYIIEEGLNSRTTNIDYAVPPDRNGKTYLAPCLYSHAPIDLVVLGLGGNDMKTYFHRSAYDIKVGLQELVEIIQASLYGAKMNEAPQILITTPAISLPFVEDYLDENGEKFLKGIVKKSQQLVLHYQQLATEKSCHFLDLSNEIKPSEIDGVHYDQFAHQKIARLMCSKIVSIFK